MSKQLDTLDLNANSRKALENDEVDEVELECLDTQIGGHTSQIERHRKTKLGIYDLKNGLILKTLFPPPRGPRELNFYQNVFSPECDSDLLELRSFIPTFYGTEERRNTTMLKMTNLTAPFTKPCIMDLKMGRVTYDQEASAEKIHHEDIKFPPIKKTGFQIIGMMIQNQIEQKKIDKNYTRSLCEKTLVTDGLGAYFSVLKDQEKRQVIHGLISRLKLLEKWFLKQKKVSFIASSLLFIYEGMNGKAIECPTVNKTTTTTANGDNNQTSSVSDELSSSKSNENSPTLLGSRKRSHDNSAVVVDDDDNHKKSGCDHNNTESSSKIVKGKDVEIISTNVVQDSSEKSQLQSLTLNNNKSTDTAAVCDTINTSCDSIPAFSVHLIDFAHVFPTSKTDENFLFGLQNLISSLQGLAE